MLWLLASDVISGLCFHDTALESRIRLCMMAVTQSLMHMQMHIRVVEAVVGRLLMAACADGSIAVRRAILHSVQEPSSLDIYLAQADA